MAVNSDADMLLGVLQQTFIAIIRSDGRDLSARQFAVFLTCYLQDRDHTVRGFAAELGIPKPSVTLALNRLEELELAKRTPDPRDRRSVLVVRTPRGNALIRNLRSILTAAQSDGMDSHLDSANNGKSASETAMARRPRL